MRIKVSVQDVSVEFSEDKFRTEFSQDLQYIDELVKKAIMLLKASKKEVKNVEQN